MSERIEPMPEELASGHEGRMALFMGARDRREFDHWLRRKLAKTAPGQIGASRVAQLAAACEMPPVDYARQHSMLGVLRAVARTQYLGLHGASQGEAMTRRMGMVNQKSAAYVCPVCVEEDLNHWKFSWFRRTHHLLGTDWCPSHKTRLLKVLSKDPWSKLPQDWVQSGNVEPVQHCDGISEITPFEERISDISCALLRHSAPIEIDRVREVLVARATNFKLRICSKGTRPLVSDLVLKLAPRLWLHRHWPEMKKKSDGCFVSAIDKGVSQRNVAISGFGYTTIFASLWDTSEEAIHLLSQLQHTDLAAPPRERAITKQRGEVFWHGEFFNVYIESQGRIKNIAEQLGMDMGAVRTRISQLGLPALTFVTSSANWKAYLRFEAGEGLSEACTAEGADQVDVEQLIRQSLARVASAAKAVIATQIALSSSTSQKKISPSKLTLKNQTTIHPEKAVV